MVLVSKDQIGLEVNIFFMIILFKSCMSTVSNWETVKFKVSLEKSDKFLLVKTCHLFLIHVIIFFRTVEARSNRLEQLRIMSGEVEDVINQQLCSANHESEVQLVEVDKKDRLEKAGYSLNLHSSVPDTSVLSVKERAVLFAPI